MRISGFGSFPFASARAFASSPLVAPFLASFVVACSSSAPGSFGSGSSGGAATGATGTTTSGGGSSGGATTGGDTGVDNGVNEFQSEIDDSGGVVFEWPATQGTEVYLVLVQGAKEFALEATDDRVVISGTIAGLEKGDGHYRVEVGSGDSLYVAEQGQVKYGDRFTTFFDTLLTDDGPVLDIPFSVTEGATHAIAATAGAKGLRPRVYVATPKGPVDIIEVQQGNLAEGESFTFDYAFGDEGTYVVELVRADGLPAAVLPVYVDGPMPIVTPPLDRPMDPIYEEPIPLQEARDKITQLTNEKRSNAGLSALGLHNKLNDSAQAKAEQMAEHGIFAHSTADGKIEKVGVHAGAQGLSGNFSENIGVEVNPERVWLGLWWSPSHRVPMLDDRWKSQGVGAAMFNAQYNHVIFVQHFADSSP